MASLPFARPTSRTLANPALLRPIMYDIGVRVLPEMVLAV